MKTLVHNMKMEVTVEDGDDLGGGLTYKGPPRKIVKHLAKHEWDKLVEEGE